MALVQHGRNLIHRDLLSLTTQTFKQQELIGTKLFTPHEVDSVKKEFIKFDKSDFITYSDIQIGIYGDTKEVGHDNPETGNIDLKSFGLHQKVSNREVYEDKKLKILQRKTLTLQQRLHLMDEYETAQIAKDSNNYLTGMKDTPVTKFDDASIKIINEIEDRIELFRKATGVRPNTMAMGFFEWYMLSKNDNLITVLGSEVTIEALKNKLMLKDIIVGGATHIPDPKGSDLSSEVPEDIWSGFIGLYYLDNSNDEVLTFGRRFYINSPVYKGAGVVPLVETSHDASKLKVYDNWQKSIVCPEAGYLITLPFALV